MLVHLNVVSLRTVSQIRTGRIGLNSLKSDMPVVRPSTTVERPEGDGSVESETRHNRLQKPMLNFEQLLLMDNSPLLRWSEGSHDHTSRSGRHESSMMS